MSKHVQKYPLHRFPALALPAGALLLFATAACLPGTELEAEPEPDPSWTSGLDDVDLSPVTPAGDQWNTCPTWDCNKNHPMLTGFPVPEVNETGLPDDLNLRLTSFQQGAKLLSLDVDRGEIKGYGKFSGVLEVAGASAIGSILTISNLEVTWRIRIEAYALIPYWVGTRAYVPAYRLLYQRAGDSPSLWFNVCKAPEEPALDPMWPDGFETYALLISDERYDRDAKRVRDDGNAEGWFNIACAGTALAKMVLMRFDPHIPPGDDYRTTPDQRTATLKMLTADYLGIGEAFTVGGHPLQWASESGWHTVPVPGSAEAVWDADGAVCLDTPRLVGEVIDGNPPLTEEAILAALADTCAAYNSDHPGVVPPPCELPPKCAEVTIGPGSWVWTSYNP